ncbi:hypothetical protein [Rhizobium leguminosarum]
MFLHASQPYQIHHLGDTESVMALGVAILWEDVRLRLPATTAVSTAGSKKRARKGSLPAGFTTSFGTSFRRHRTPYVYPPHTEPFQSLLDSVVNGSLGSIPKTTFPGPEPFNSTARDVGHHPWRQSQSSF